MSFFYRVASFAHAIWPRNMLKFLFYENVLTALKNHNITAYSSEDCSLLRILWKDGGLRSVVELQFAMG